MPASQPPRSPTDPMTLSPLQLQRLAALSRELADAAGLPLFVTRLAGGLAPLIGFDRVSLAMKAPDGRLWGLVRSRQAAGPDPDWQGLADPSSPLMEAFLQNRPVLRQTAAASPPAESEGSLQELGLLPSALCVPLQGPDGPLGALGIFALVPQQYSAGDVNLITLLASAAENIARRLLLVDEAARADQARLRSDRLREELLEQLSAEILSPLSVLDNGLSLLRSAVSSAEATQTREQVDELRLVASTLTETVRSLVELGQLDDGTRAIRPAMTSLDGFLRERVQARSLAARLGEARMFVRCDPTAVQITTDLRLLARIVDNLLLNALRHTPKRGEIALVAVFRARNLTLAVADTGAPIPEPEREAILSRDPRGYRSTTRAFGLGYARAAVEYLGGRLAVEAPPGVGNLFRITLPMSGESVSAG